MKKNHSSLSNIDEASVRKRTYWLIGLVGVPLVLVILIVLLNPLYLDWQTRKFHQRLDAVSSPPEAVLVNSSRNDLQNFFSFPLYFLAGSITSSNRYTVIGSSFTGEDLHSFYTLTLRQMGWEDVYTSEKTINFRKGVDFLSVSIFCNLPVDSKSKSIFPSSCEQGEIHYEVQISRP